MYFVDREKIEQTLVYLEEKTAFFNHQLSWETETEKLALERTVHMIIESILDVGNSMIDGFIMRDPGSYDDIIDILDDEKVVAKEMTPLLKNLIQVRKQLVQEYMKVDHGKVILSLEDSMPAVNHFPGSIRKYLETELGPVSAFKN
ncbi:DUF86 domain-containing protein [Jeotgalibacillus campisalis]|uniref:DUF86 domain-containing protein n=1 Tax=Jeotgalibacillus campisalis TaxID=220754 RepID=A0A0C2RPL3_9BACL|nr:DUF86 domain-containing protein [Jeotgalibacillus campisalis]KIL43689.1 hypothetical protein KR50_32090 [Jeotgalibacillus campisalis]